MAIAIDGFTLVARVARIARLLEEQRIAVPNATALADDYLWRVSFMVETDAKAFLAELEALDLNGSRGPDPDLVIVNEFDESIAPYCEWLETARWEKAVVAWMCGTEPTTVTAREGWDPKVGSGLTLADDFSEEKYEFLRLQDHLEVYRHRETGEETYVARTSEPVEALYNTAAEVVKRHFVDPGKPAREGKAADELSEAISMLSQVLKKLPDAWGPHWFLGKAHAALGNHRESYSFFKRAYDLNRDTDAVFRELCGACLLLSRFDEAVQIGEEAVALDPKNACLLGNLAVSYVLAGRIIEARKTIEAAVSFDSDDVVNKYLRMVILEIIDEKRALPTSLQELMRRKVKQRRAWWKFWA